jgi:hypothetical protein
MLPKSRLSEDAEHRLFCDDFNNPGRAPDPALARLPPTCCPEGKIRIGSQNPPFQVMPIVFAVDLFRRTPLSRSCPPLQGVIPDRLHIVAQRDRQQGARATDPLADLLAISPKIGPGMIICGDGAVKKGGKAWDDPETAAPSPQHRTRLLRLHPKQCRFIVSEEVRDALCCEAPTAEGSSWCAWHRQLVYVPHKPERGRQCMGLSRRASMDPLPRP